MNVNTTACTVYVSQNVLRNFYLLGILDYNFFVSIESVDSFTPSMVHFMIVQRYTEFYASVSYYDKELEIIEQEQVFALPFMGVTKKVTYLRCLFRRFKYFYAKYLCENKHLVLKQIHCDARL